MNRILFHLLLGLLVATSSICHGADIIWVHQMRGGGDGENNPGRR